MVLNMPSIFPKDENVATVIVAKDNTGDTDSIQEGINLLPADGGVVYIKEGTYNLTTHISFPVQDNISLIGSGKSTEIVVPAGDTGMALGSNNGILIKDLYLHGSGGATGHGIQMTNSTDCRIIGCWIEGFGLNGIIHPRGSNLLVDGCFIFSNSVGILLDVTAGDVDRAIITNNAIYSNGSDGIKLSTAVGTTCNYVVINGNNIYSNTGFGVNIADNRCDRNLMVGNIIYTNTGGEIQDNGTNTTNSGNLVA